jgi:hypothetical protein
MFFSASVNSGLRFLASVLGISVFLVMHSGVAADEDAKFLIVCAHVIWFTEKGTSDTFEPPYPNAISAAEMVLPRIHSRASQASIRKNACPNVFSNRAMIPKIQHTNPTAPPMIRTRNDPVAPKRNMPTHPTTVVATTSPTHLSYVPATPCSWNGLLRPSDRIQSPIARIPAAMAVEIRVRIPNTNQNAMGTASN